MGKDDGGCAFPRVNPEYTKNNDGMTLLDWFAGQALAGAMVGDEEGVLSHAKMAEYCYRQAAAMLAAREKRA